MINPLSEKKNSSDPAFVKKGNKSAPKTPVNDNVSYYAVVTVIILCFFCYGNTLSLKYAYDDLVVITGNSFTKQGFHGIGDILSTDSFTGYFGKDQTMVSGGRYRPLSLVTFALEYQFFGENPLISHLINVFLYILTCILILFLLKKLALSGGFIMDREVWYTSAPLLITLLFVTHPIHTEVVSNIKSRDEILAFLFCLLTLHGSLKVIEEKKGGWSFAIGTCFFMALLSKEISRTFLLIVPLTINFFTKHGIKRCMRYLIPMLVATVVFLLIRQSVVGHTSHLLQNDLMNNPFVEMTFLQRYATILYTLGLYVKLLIYPHPLTSDYYPYHIPIINPSDWQAILSLAVYILMISYIIVKFRKKDLAAYCFLYFLITISIVSNFFFPVGAFLCERFLFIPSLAYCILLASGFIWITRSSSVLKGVIGIQRTVLPVLMLLTLTLYVMKTVSRNADWYDSYTLFTTDVRVSQNSAKGNEVAGEYIMQKAGLEKDKAVRDSMLRRSIAYQQKAIRIYPKQIVALFNLAAAYYQYNQDYDTILVLYKTILRYVPEFQQVYTFFDNLMGKYDNIDHKIQLYYDLLQLNPRRFDVNMNLGLLYLAGKQDAVNALPYLEKAETAKPSDFEAQKILGTAYAYLGRWNESLVHLEKAEKIKPGDVELEKNLTIVNHNMRVLEKSRQSMAGTKK